MKKAKTSKLEQSLLQAKAELEAATQEVAQMMRQAELAELSFRQAEQELNEAKRNQKGSKESSYSEEHFWENRYMKEKKNDSSGGKYTLYEWYVSFDDIEAILREDLLIAASRNNEDLSMMKLLVPGCGNSSFCEDLARKGCNNIVGIDYSTTVVEEMNKRLSTFSNPTGVEYIHGDCKKLTSFPSHSVSAVIDKGTLDAICSAVGDSNNNTYNNGQTTSSKIEGMKYIYEMWRVLKINGVLIMITTMSTEIFRAIVFETLGDGAYSNWRDCRKQAVRTGAGDEVMYFAITKLKDCQLQLQDSEVNKPVDGLSAFLLQAEQIFTDPAAAGIVMTEQEELEKGLSEPVGANDLSDIDPKETPRFAVNIALSTAAGQHASSFHVLDVVTVNYVISSGGEEDAGVQEGSVWNEDDLICLVAASTSTEDHSSSFYFADEVPYETCEYTEAPTSTLIDSNTRIQEENGMISFKLPSFGGTFFFSYMRPTRSSAASSRQSMNKMTECGRSSVFTVNWPVYNCSPDVLLPLNASIRRRGVGPLTCVDSTDNSLQQQHQLPSSKGNSGANTQPSHFNLPIFVENLQSIRTMLVTVLKPQDTAFLRCMTWLTDASTQQSNCDSRSKLLILEIDLMRSEQINGCYSPSPPKTSYICIELPEYCNVDDSNDRSSKEKSNFNHRVRTVYNTSAAVGMVDITNGVIVVRLPYNLQKDENVDLNSSKLSAKDKTECECEVVCHFCEAPLVLKENLRVFHPLPTGLFDNMMADFVCCEEAPAQAMCSADVIPRDKEALYGPIQLCVPPASIVPDSIAIHCKATATLLDTFSSQSAVLSLTTIDAVKKNLDVKNEEICIDTCLLSCLRCGSYLGDGQIAGDDCGDLSCLANTSSNKSKKSFSDNNFDLSDMSYLKFSRHLVNFHPQPAELSIGNMNTESILVNALLHYSDVYGISSFLLTLADYSTSHNSVARKSNENDACDDCSGTTNEFSLFESVIHCRLVNKQYGVRCDTIQLTSSSQSKKSLATIRNSSTCSKSSSSPSSQELGYFLPAVKVAFVHTRLADITGSSTIGLAKLHLQFSDYQEILSQLTARCKFSSTGNKCPYKGFQLSHLLK